MAAPMIQPSHAGRLHAAMGVPSGKKLKLSDILRKKSAAKSAGNTALEKQATFAQNARQWNHAG